MRKFRQFRLRSIWISLLVVLALSGCLRPFPGQAPVLPQQLTLTPAPTLPPVTPQPPATQSTAQPDNPATPLAQPPDSPAEIPGTGGGLAAVAFVSAENVLNLRAEPGSSAQILDSLPYNTRDLLLSGAQETVDGITWVELTRPGGISGWASADFLTTQVEPQVFCSQAELGTLLAAFASAVKAADGTALAQLVSPRHGLTVYLNSWNPPVSFSAEQISGLYRDETPYEWGIGAGSGEPIQGRFGEVIQPLLLDVLNGAYSQPCNTLELNVATGGTTALVQFPAELTNLNFVALYRPALPQSPEMDWRTWAVGVELVDGRYYIAALVQYHWEI